MSEARRIAKESIEKVKLTVEGEGNGDGKFRVSVLALTTSLVFSLATISDELTLLRELVRKQNAE